MSPHVSQQTKPAPLAGFCHQLMAWAQGLHRALLQSCRGSPSVALLHACSAVLAVLAVIAFHTPDRAQPDLPDATGGADGSLNTSRRVQDDFMEARLGEIEMSSVIWHLKHEGERLCICFHLHLPLP